MSSMPVHRVLLPSVRASSNRLSKAFLVYHVCSNWHEVIGALAKHTIDDHSSTYQLRFRDGSSHQTHIYRNALVAVYFQYYSRVLGLEPKIDQPELLHAAERVNSQLINTFSSEGRLQPTAGGVFGLKEVLLYSIVKSIRPEIIVETGVGQGVSSTAILLALKTLGHGRLISIDLPNFVTQGYVNADGQRDWVHLPADKSTGWLVPDELRSKWTLLIGSSRDLLPSIRGNIDMFFHDSDHSYVNMTYEYEWAITQLSNGGVLSSDDVGWNHAYRDFLRKHPQLSDRIRSEGFHAAQLREG